MEKGHPNMFNTLLQVLDDGRLTDGQRANIYFANTVIILTSNLRAGNIFNGQKEKALKEVRNFLPAEFVNMIDEIVVFNPLSTTELRKICRIQLKEVARCLVEKRLVSEVTEEAVGFIISKKEKGLNSVQGQ